ncbi:EAL domain-containing protein [Tsukamurella sp. 1534]|uniref:sensor domain-containing protein n=1 Tax=Tsukamurella sp. 1534 TaxID=1151061 RepID=UPI0002F3DBA3|nr:EAL domain-containing protein [Tsukamurella sp. 1534]
MNPRGDGPRLDDGFYRAFIEMSLDGFFVHDADGRFVAVNDTACITTGYSREELLRMNALEVVQVTVDDARRTWDTAMAGASVLVPAMHRRKDGTTFPVEAHISCLAIDGHTYIVGLIRDITDRVASDRAKQEATRRLEERVAESRTSSQRVANLLQAVIDTAPDLVYIKDRDGRYQYVNAAVSRLMGIPVATAVGKDDSQLFPADLAQTLIATDRAIMDSGIGREVEEYPVVDGERRTYLSNKAPYWGASGDVVGLIGISRDITATRRDQALLRHVEARWQFAIDGAGDGIWDWDVGSGTVFYSQQWKAMLGYSDEDVGTSVEDWAGRVHPDDYVRCWEIISQVVRGEVAEFRFEHRMRTKDGSWRWIHDRGRAMEIGPSGLPSRLIGTHTDITDRRSSEEEIRELNLRLRRRADHDDLTDLLGRAGFIERATEVVRRRRADGAALAVLWIDLDSFKRINDSLGHKLGDQVLQVVARRLVDASLATDLVARLGGDEFVVLRPRVAGGDPTEEWAERVRAAMGEPVEIDGLQLTVTCSIGLVESGATDDGISQLLIDGDLALLQAKRDGRNRIVQYTAGLRAPQQERVALATRVRAAVEGGDVVVRYQPVVDLATGERVGAEALTRIAGPDGAELAPAEFLPHLEALGLLPALARLVLGRACADFAADPSLGWVSVNLASEDLADPQLPSVVERTLERTGLDPARLILEINERVVPERHVLAATHRLIELGARIALDDFGTGWSSLAQLKDLDLALVKIDRSVVVASARREDHRLEAMLTAAIAMARALDLDVIAEGVEQPEQAAALAAAGARYAQGFLWSPAVDVDVLAGLRGYAGAMTNPGDAQPTGDQASEPIDAEIVDTPAPAAPSLEEVTGYTAGGVPTFDHVRDRIEQRTTTALGAEELAHGTAAGQDTERRFAEREKAAKAKLDEIRASMNRTPPDAPA